MRRAPLTAALCLLALVAPSRAQRSGDPPGVGELGGPATQLSPADQQRFLRGRADFARDFRPSEGLGTPELNADSCRACHRDPVGAGAGGLEFNVSRFGKDNGGFGPFQDLAGGQIASKLRPPAVGGREEYDQTRADVFEQRQSPALFGLGLLDGVSDAEILAHEDPSDADGDGIRGRARRHLVAGREELGRFGWKAQIPRLADFTKDALAGELGLTTSDDGRGFGARSDGDATADPEFDEVRVADVSFYLHNLAAPARRGSLDPQVTAGERLFAELGCARCHLPELAGAHGPVRAYTDLLLHRVVPGDFRGMAEPGAGVGLYRTPPLWGVRLSAPYLHDGSAEDLRAAIQAHFAEAQAAKNAFVALAALDQDALLAFLEDL